MESIEFIGSIESRAEEWIMPIMSYNAYNWKLNLTADGRRRTPTFCPADPAG